MVTNIVRKITSLFFVVALVFTSAACTKSNYEEAVKREKAERDAKLATAEEKVKEAQEALKKAEKSEADAKASKEVLEMAITEREGIAGQKEQDLAAREAALAPKESDLLTRAQALSSAEEANKLAKEANDAAIKALNEQKDTLEKEKEEYKAKKLSDTSDMERREKEINDKIKVNVEQLAECKDREEKIAAEYVKIAELRKIFRREVDMIRDILASKYADDVFARFQKGETVPAFIGYDSSSLPRAEILALREKIATMNTATKYTETRKLIPISINAQYTSGSESVTDTFLVEASVENLIALRDELRANKNINLPVVEPVLRVNVSRKLVVKNRDGQIMQDSVIATKALQNKDFKEVNLDRPTTYIGENQSCKEMKSDCVKTILDSLNKTQVIVKNKGVEAAPAIQISYRDYLKTSLEESIKTIDMIIKSGKTKFTLGKPFNLARSGFVDKANRAIEAAKNAITQDDIENQDFVGYVELSYGVSIMRDRAKDDLPISPLLNKERNESSNAFVRQHRETTAFIPPIRSTDTTNLPTPNSFVEHRDILTEVLNAIK